MTIPDIDKLTIHSARELLDSGQVSSVELTQKFLKRIECVDRSVKAFVTVSSDEAIKQAEEADNRISRGEQEYLTGIPVQLKDNLCTKDILTTCSSYMLKDFVPPYDAHVTTKLKEDGAVLIGKGNLDEFAMGSSTENSAFHPTHNPWDLQRVPGGSSGGPAAAVAAGECVASLGSDTGGSIRQPASLCGVVGMKPTYGLVSRYGLIAFASSLDQIGPITKDVTDNTKLLNTISGYDPRDSTSLNTPNIDYSSFLDKNLEGFRVGIPVEYFSQGISEEVQKQTYDAIDVLKSLGADIKGILNFRGPHPHDICLREDFFT